MAHDKFTPQKAALAAIKANANAAVSVPALRDEVANLCDLVDALLSSLAAATADPDPTKEPRAMIVDNS